MNTEKVISNLSAVLGILSFIGTIVVGFVGEKVAAYFLIGSTLLFWLIWLTVKIITLSGQIQKLTRGGDTISSIDQSGNQIVKRLVDAPHITYGSQKQEKVNASFLGYDECTLLIHVLVSKENTGIRAPRSSDPNNLKTTNTLRYILGHREISENKEINRFGLRYSGGKKWEAIFSNSKNDTCHLSRNDGLEPGWHQFMIAWSKKKPQIDFLIDGGSTETSTTFLDRWPQHFADTVSVGMWKSSDPGSYVDTRLAHLWIVNKYLIPSDPIVENHKRLQQST